MNNLKSYIIIISILLGITTINGCGKASSNTPTLPETEKTASEYIDIEKTDNWLNNLPYKLDLENRRIVEKYAKPKTE